MKNFNLVSLSMATTLYVVSLSALIFLISACEKTIDDFTPPSIPIFQMEGEYSKTVDGCFTDQPDYTINITKKKPVKDDVVHRVDDGIMIISNLANAKKSRILAVPAGDSYIIEPQKTILHKGSVEISGMMYKSGNRLFIDYRLIPENEPTIHCSSEFQDI